MRLRLAGLLAAGLMVGTVATPDVADDEDRVGDALAESSIRMLQAGLSAAGPGTRDTEFVSGCLGGLDAPGRLPSLPGETARGVSNVYLFRPDAEAAPEVGELFTVAVVAVDEADRPAIDQLVLLLGDPETARCRRMEFLDGADAVTSAADADPVVEVETLPDLGIADASARFDMQIVFTSNGREHRVAYSYLAARAGRMLVLLRLATFGDGRHSGIDAQTELTAIVESLEE